MLLNKVTTFRSRDVAFRSLSALPVHLRFREGISLADVDCDRSDNDEEFTAFSVATEILLTRAFNLQLFLPESHNFSSVL